MKCANCGRGISITQAYKRAGLCGTCSGSIVWAGKVIPHTYFETLWRGDVCRAYTLAGHAVMACLIGDHGVCGELFNAPLDPMGWGELVPEFEAVSINGPHPDWAKAKSHSLKKLTTVQIILLAGYVAQKKRFEFPDDQVMNRLPFMRKALSISAGYCQEYAGDADVSRSFDLGRGLLFDHMVFTCKVFDRYWGVVAQVANLLMDGRSVSREEISRACNVF